MYEFMRRQAWAMWLGIMLVNLGVAVFTWKCLIYAIILIVLVDWHSGELGEIFNE